jgi:aminopeptidase N
VASGDYSAGRTAAGSRLARGARLAIMLAFAPAANAQVAPTYQPGIDVLDYDVGLTLPDTGNLISGDVTVTLRRAAGVARVRLDLIDLLTVRRVEVNGRQVQPARGGNRIDVPLDGAGDSTRVRVVYDGPVNDGLVVRKDSRGRWTWFGDNWPDRARQWLPTVDHPSDKATVSWRVVAPESRTVVANGELVGTKLLAGRGARQRETRWRESRPIATYLMVIAAGPLVKHDISEPACHVGDKGQCVRQQVYVMPENAHWLPGVFSTAGPIVTLFEGLVGPFPYEKLSHLESSTRFGGMENASAIFYDGKLFATPSVSDGLIAHETAHQWFGNAVTEREWGHLWLSEGFATYFAALWTRKARGDAAYFAELAGIRKQILADPTVAARPVLDTAQTDYLKLLNANSYQKGGYVLYMLHQQLGDSAFFGGIRSYYAKHRHGNALSDDLRMELERSSKRSLAQFFDQWLRRPGVAEPSVGWAFDPATAAVTLLVMQDGPPGVYELALPVTITDATGATTRVTVNVPAERRAVVALPGRFAGKPRSIVFDADERMLARINRL